MEENRFYVYIHLKETNGDIFYVGKGSGKRAFSKNGRNKLWQNIYNKNGFVVKIIKENISEEEALEIEKYHINKYGRINNNSGILSNMTDGGEGVSGLEPWNKGMKMNENWNKGRILSDETKNKIGKANKGRKMKKPAWNKDKKLPKETIDKMKNRVPWNKGIKHSEESKKKMSEKAKDRKRSNIKINDDQIIEIIELYNNCVSSKDISIIYNVCKNTILRIIKKEKIKKENE